MLLYSGGSVGIFGLFALMNRRALKLREELELDPVEVEVTRAAIREHGLSASIGIASMLLAALGGACVPFSGLIYFLMGPAHGLLGWRTRRKLERMTRDASPAGEHQGRRPPRPWGPSPPRLG